MSASTSPLVGSVALRAPDCSAPTSPALQEEDMQALVNLFNRYGEHQSANTITVFAINHTLAQLVALGWLARVYPRWSDQTYMPAGALALRLSGLE